MPAIDPSKYANLEAQPMLMGSNFPRWDDKLPTEIMFGFEFEVDSHLVEGPIQRNQNYNYEIKDKNKPFETLPAGYTVTNESFRGGYRGYEFKSPIAPLRIHRRQIREFLSLVKTNDQKSGENNGGGIHINIEKTDTTIKYHNEVFAFLHNPANMEKLFKLSERNKDSWNSYSPQNGNVYRYPKNEQHKIMKMGIITASKHYAFELRMFHSKSFLLLPAIEFADSLFKYAPKAGDAMTWDGWVDFISSRTRYQAITDLVNKHKVG